MTVTTVVFDRVESRDSRGGLGLDPGLESYQAAQWGCFAFGMVGMLYFFSSPCVGVYYPDSLSFMLCYSYVTCHRVFQRGRCRWKEIKTLGQGGS